MFFVVLMSGLAQLLIWNFVDDYPGIVGVSKILHSHKSNCAQMTMSVLYGFCCLCFWSLATPIGLSASVFLLRSHENDICDNSGLVLRDGKPCRIDRTFVYVGRPR